MLHFMTLFRVYSVEWWHDWYIGKNLEGTSRGIIEGLSWHLSRGTKAGYDGRNLSQESRHPDWGSNRAPPEYNSGVLYQPARFQTVVFFHKVKAYLHLETSMSNCLKRPYIYVPKWLWIINSFQGIRTRCVIPYLPWFVIRLNDTVQNKVLHLSRSWGKKILEEK
jgi:hypothetical protein